jgi:hypothetical protein
LTAVLEALLSVVLIALLVGRELIDAAGGPNAKAQLAALRVVIVPLLVLFGIIVARRIVTYVG